MTPFEMTIEALGLLVITGLIWASLIFGGL